MYQFIELDPESLRLHAGVGELYQSLRESLLAGLKGSFIGDNPDQLLDEDPAAGQIEVTGQTLSDLLNLLTRQGWEIILTSPRRFVLQYNAAELFRAIIGPEQIARFTFENFKPEGYGLSEDRRRNLRMAYETAHNFACKLEDWLVIQGGCGCGKTHLAAAIANYVTGQGQPVMFVSLPDFLDYLKDYSSGHSLNKHFDQICAAPLLILDDLQMPASLSVQQKLFQLLNYRYLAQLPTIVTNRGSLEELDIYIRSRLVDPDLSKFIRILAPDFRQAATIIRGKIGPLSTLYAHTNQTFNTFSLRQKELHKEGVESLKRVLDKAQSYAKKPEGWLVFSGGHGCGKTHLAAAVANHVHHLGDEAIFIPAFDLLDHLRAIFAPDNSAFQRDFQDLREIELLVIDDLRQYKSKDEWDRLLQLLEDRYWGKRPTVLTLSKDTDLDERWKMRLLDLDYCTTLKITTPPYWKVPPKKDSSG